MLDLMKKTIEKHSLIEYGDKIVVAVSGGADSVSLLHSLYMLKEEYNLTLYTCHLNHMLRGKDADDDAKYVEELSEELSIESFIEAKDIEEYSKQMKMSFEEAAREARYDLFDRVINKTKANKIAVAQNMNDQAETVLMRLARGSGLEGLTAIKYKRDNIIRPLLAISREEIEKYCTDNKLLVRTDQTNFETVYTRNKIRLELIPYLKDKLNENVIHQIHNTSELLQNDLDFIIKEVEKKYASIVVKEDNKLVIRVEKLNSCHLSIKSRIIRKIIDKFDSLKGISSEHINELINMCENSSHGASKTIKKYITFEICYNYLQIYDKRLIAESKVYENVKLYEAISINEFTFTSFDGSREVNDNCSITIDKEKIKGKLSIRNRKAGDRFYPLGMKGSKKLKDFFINLKIESKERDSILLLCDDEEIIWVVGYRMSEKYKVDSNTTSKISFCLKK